MCFQLKGKEIISDFNKSKLHIVTTKNHCKEHITDKLIKREWTNNEIINSQKEETKEQKWVGQIGRNSKS